jgi:hypothetical protein
MKLFIKLVGVEALLERLRRGSEAAASGTARTAEAYRTIGALECEVQRANYVDRSRGGSAGGVKWRGLSPLTALLRRSGATKKLPGWSALVDLAATLPILVDTGRLLASLAPGSPGNVLEPAGTSVTFGTSVDYAEKMHAGGQSDAPMIASREDADAVASRRILKVLPGHKSGQTGGGRKSRAKKNWNPEFFQIRGWLRNRVGVIATVSARPVLTIPAQDRLDGYAERVKAAIVEDLRR